MPIIKIYPSKRPVRGILQYITRGDTVPEELIRTGIFRYRALLQ